MSKVRPILFVISTRPPEHPPRKEAPKDQTKRPRARPIAAATVLRATLLQQTNSISATGYDGRMRGRDKADDTGSVVHHPEGVASQDRSTHRFDEEVYTQLYHLLMLALVHHPSRPTVDLFAPGQTRLRDAYLLGCLNREGEIVNRPPERTQQQNAEYKIKTETLLRGLIERITTKSKQNFLDGLTESNPIGNGEARPTFWKFVITLDLVDEYRYFREACGLDEKSEVAYPEEHETLWHFLEKTVAEQYDFDQWTHMSMLKPKKIVRQKPLVEGEIFEPSEGMVIAGYMAKVPGTDIIYTQQDVIPDIQEAPAEEDENDEQKDNEEQIDKGKKKHNIYIHLDLTTVKVPPKSEKAGAWIYHKGTDVWTRKDGKEWRLVVLLRMFDADTHQYLGFRLNIAKVRDADPKDDAWRTSFNKWVSQLVRRNTERKVVVRDHWTTEELAVLFKAINASVYTNGMETVAVDKLPKAWNKVFFEDIAVNVNKVLDRMRTFEAVRAYVRNQITKTKSGAIFDLTQRAMKLKARIDTGEDIPRNERYPEEAIPVLEHSFEDQPLTEEQ
ncbi:hypothetical protein FB567DRAFT_544542 [Paraphoma chrysanthemicola]|uniref:Uncharacterized protein n=1 Tax=Paraphoma chrysanthemicola TaxID=798071 RepID=A0A8K0W3B9_9PLEO|nr:hypothetical protein FB567DRAFT_544542 [Paraphoma chrysanthemicola]